MAYTDTYYLKFNSELGRKLAEEKFTNSPYYIESYSYERDNDASMSGRDYMLAITLGNYFGEGDKVRGKHVPIPLLPSEVEDTGTHNNVYD